eukprot:1967537-Lingulodinium_polyedra.AAC.1
MLWGAARGRPHRGAWPLEQGRPRPGDAPRLWPGGAAAPSHAVASTAPEGRVRERPRPWQPRP